MRTEKAHFMILTTDDLGSETSRLSDQLLEDVTRSLQARGDAN